MSSSASTSQPVLRISTVHGVPDILRELGQDPSHVIDDLGFDPTLFDNPDNRITLAERGRLLECCAKVSGCPHFGLLVGQRDGLGQLGIVGLLARHSPDVGTALRRLIRHFHLQAQGVEIGLAVDGGRALFSYAIAEDGVTGIDQVGDGAVAAQFNIMRELCGPDFKALAAWFVRPSPKNLKPYRDVFEMRLQFDAPIYGLEFSSSWLTRRLPSTDEALTQLIAEKISVLESQNAEDHSEDVRRMMQTALAFNHVDAHQIASMLGLHVRTYHRRLHSDGTSHRELLDETRMNLACRLLKYSSKDIAEISTLLGYAESRSFAPQISSYEKVVQSWDTAAVPGHTSDWSVCITWGLLGQQVHLLEVHRARYGFPELVHAAKNLHQRWKPSLIVVEKASSGIQLGQQLQAEGLRPIVQALPPVGDKVGRMAAQSPKLESGQVLLPASAPWKDAFLSECAAFPKAPRTGCR